MIASPEQEPISGIAPAPATFDECRGLLALSEMLLDHTAGRMGTVASRQIHYWGLRVEYEQRKQLAAAEGGTPPEFNYKDKRGDEKLPLSDAQRGLRLLSLYENASSAQGFSLNLADFGFTDERMEAIAAAIKQGRENQKQEQMELRAREYARKAHREEHQLQITLDSNTQIKQLVEADILQPISLLETPIRKDNIAPTLLAVVGSFARRGFLEAIEDTKGSGQPVKMLFKEEVTELAVEKIIKGYHGNVGAVIGTKMPVTSEFLAEYFAGLKGSVVPGSVTRLQFDAALTPTGKTPFVSRVNTVVYQGANDNGERRIVTTVRKADRLVAELAIQSLLDEAKIATMIIDSNAYEVLAGLPSLGKASK